MDCAPVESQITSNSQLDTKVSAFRQNIGKNEKVYAMYQRNKHNKPKNKKYFDHVDSRRIKLKLDQIKKNAKQDPSNLIKMGFYTIDLKLKEVF